MAASDSGSSDDEYDRLPDEFTPKTEVVKQLVSALGAQPNERGEQPWARQILEQFKGRLDFNCHLCFIFICCRQASFEVRLRAGYLLKNNIKRRQAIEHMPGYMQKYIKSQVLRCLGATVPEIRSAVATIISAFVGVSGFDGWPHDLLKGLLVLMNAGEPAKLQGSLVTLSMICEDHLDALRADRRKPLTQFVPRWIELLHHDDVGVKATALNCLVCLLSGDMPPVVMAHFELFLRGLFHVADVSRKERSLKLAQLVCQAFRELVRRQSDLMRAHIDRIVDYTLTAAASSNEQLALTACAFFPRLAQTELNLVAFSTPERLKRLVGVLLRGVMIRDDDPMIEESQVPSSVPDTVQDLPPQHHQDRRDYDDGEEDDDDGEHRDDGDYDDDDDWAGHQEEQDELSQFGETKWSLRSCSALTLDMMACTHGSRLLSVLLPLASAGAKPGAPWKIVEASIVAIGAVANGCAKSIAPHLPKLHGWIVSMRKHPNPLVRVIVAWTLSRYADWIVAQAETDRFFRPTLMTLLEMLRDTSKLVQTSAIFGLRAMQASARDMLTPYLPAVFKYYCHALQHFQVKNRSLVLSLVQRLCRTVGPELPRFARDFMKTLVAMWVEELKDRDSYLLYPLMATFTELSTTLGLAFQPYAKPLFVYCLNAVNKAIRNPDGADDVDTVHAKIYSFDLIAGICEGLGQDFATLLSDEGRVDVLMPLLLKSMGDQYPQVRQAAFSLAGDLSRHCVRLIGRYMPKVIEALSLGIDPGETSGACNNAAWALSEIVLHVGAGNMAPYTPNIVDRLIVVVTEDPNNLPSGLMTNCALALGRFCLMSPKQVAPKLDKFFKPFCRIVKHAPDDAEKEQALKGLCLIVNMNPQPVRNFFPLLCEVFLSWHDWELLRAEPGQPGLKNLVCDLLKRFKRAAGSEWDNYYNSRHFPLELRQDLHRIFGFT